MDDWLTGAAGGQAVLVTVVLVEGSGPREPGAKMLVTAKRLHGTIGGGHLELRAAEIGRAMLGTGEARRIERFALGPSLGQCCGGVVHLAFESLDAAHAALLAARRGEDSWRLSAFDGAPETALFDANGSQVAGARAPLFSRSRGAHLLQEQDGRRWLVDPLLPPRAHLMLFGAGHVGAAIVRALAALPCRVTWVDERDDMFPLDVPPNASVEATDIPEALVGGAPAGTSFLVMTHSHALDQRLAEAILSRPGADWFGLIGSHTKRKQFERRLRARGIGQARIDAMVCPIGLPGISGKAPAVIAASVAAQLLEVWEAVQAGNAAAPCLRLLASSERI
ncbi:MAG: xanthine dehydrogenase accessory protein XdhC [Massilia sp.]